MLTQGDGLISKFVNRRGVLIHLEAYLTGWEALFKDLLQLGQI